MPSTTQPLWTDDALTASLTVRLWTLDGIPPLPESPSYIQVMFHTYLTLLIVSPTSYANCDTHFTYCFTCITYLTYCTPSCI
jgi:hypothetical protein